MFQSLSQGPLEVSLDSSIQHYGTSWAHQHFSSILLVAIPKVIFQGFPLWWSIHISLLPCQPFLQLFDFRQRSSSIYHVDNCWRGLRNLNLLEFHPEVFSGLTSFSFRIVGDLLIEGSFN